ncbi:MAG: type II toxin-antitoxin system HicA family toxin [Planctomycetales bacterium]|nr:type II toxin-antitoxin system HicA family toxin [Planctomycetales bacterium]MBN8624835.1 type II toxin-antitoxin system HicA family toxin [Planctomycetota bacterium]
MVRLPRITGSEMVRFLQRSGFQLLRVRGSHHFLERHDLRTTVPVHGSQVLKIGTLRSILRDIQLSPEDFERALRS